MLAGPGLTAIRNPAEARAMLLDDALRAADLVRSLSGPIVDVGSGGGSPGIPLAFDAAGPAGDAARGGAAQVRLPRALGAPNASVVWGRAEEQEPDAFGVALAKALGSRRSPPSGRLPLVRPGGAAVLWLGPSADLAAVAAVSERLGGAPPEVHDGLVVAPEARAHAARLSAPGRRREEAAARLTGDVTSKTDAASGPVATMAAWPGSTRCANQKGGVGKTTTADQPRRLPCRGG